MAGPDFLIVGAMKSATSTLHEQLAAQPGIFMTSPKEPNFFSDDEQYQKGRAWYESLFDGANVSDLKGESSTHYTKLPLYPKTIERMLEFGLKKPKLIYVVRHPVDRLISHYMHEWSQGNITSPIDEAIMNCPELVSYSLYHKQISPYIETFGQENVKIVFFSQLKNNSQRELESICDFIGYNAQPMWSAEMGHRNVSTQRVKKFPLYDLLIESKLMTILRRSLVPKSMRTKMRESLTLNKRPEISRKSRETIEGLFNQDLKKFGDIIDRPISCETFDRSA